MRSKQAFDMRTLSRHRTNHDGIRRESCKLLSEHVNIGQMPKLPSSGRLSLLPGMLLSCNLLSALKNNLFRTL